MTPTTQSGTKCVGLAADRAHRQRISTLRWPLLVLRHLDGKRLQWCWAHLKRDIQKLIDSPDGQVKWLGHEPTNNTAERTPRPAVIYRKLSFGTQSAAGSRYLERILTISETCRLQNRNAYEFLIESMRTRFTGKAAPSLLPTTAKPNLAAA